MSSIKLMRAGVLASVALVAFVIGLLVVEARPSTARAADAQSNDSWANREYLSPEFPYGPELFPFDRDVSNAGATLEPGEGASCAPTGATVWLDLYSDRYGTVVLTSVDVTYNPVVAVFKFADNQQFLPSPPGGNMIEVACDTAVGPTRVEASVIPGDHLFIQVGGVAGSQGTLRLHGECVCAPPNDQLETAADVYIDAYQPQVKLDQSTERATLQTDEQRVCGDVGAT
ncbi:MAG TPA: hypothetical protein VIH21_00350, partial [Dehalococcoidia bacterium]